MLITPYKRQRSVGGNGKAMNQNPEAGSTILRIVELLQTFFQIDGLSRQIRSKKGETFISPSFKTGCLFISDPYIFHTSNRNEN